MNNLIAIDEKMYLDLIKLLTEAHVLIEENGDGYPDEEKWLDDYRSLTGQLPLEPARIFYKKS